MTIERRGRMPPLWQHRTEPKHTTSGTLPRNDAPNRSSDHAAKGRGRSCEPFDILKAGSSAVASADDLVSALDKAKASGRSKALLPIRRNKAQHFEEAKYRFFRLGIAVSNYSDGELIRMVAASLDKKDVVLAISMTGKPRTIIDTATIAKEYGATIVSITKPNSPLAMPSDISLGLYVPETPNALKPTAARYAFLAALDLLAATFAYRNPRETQERMRRIKYALVNAGSGEADGPLGD